MVTVTSKHVPLKGGTDGSEEQGRGRATEARLGTPGVLSASRDRPSATGRLGGRGSGASKARPRRDLPSKCKRGARGRVQYTLKGGSDPDP